MTKKATQKDAVAVAVQAQINAYTQSRPLTWRVDTAKAILKIKDKAAKPEVKAKTADELQSEIIAAVSKYVGKLGVRKLTEIIKGESSLYDAFTGIATTVTILPDVKPITEAEYQSLLDSMTVEQLFSMLKALTTYNPTKAKAEAEAIKAAKAAKKSNAYISIPDKEAYEIACYYLDCYSVDRKHGRRTLAPECLRGGRTPNPTMALRRFLFSVICREECAIYNSMPAICYEFYKSKPYLKRGEDAKQDLQQTLKEEPDLMEMIKGWKDEPYIKAVLKK